MEQIPDNQQEKSEGRQPNRKLNSILFILGATAANIVLVIGLFFLMFIGYIRFFPNPANGEIMLVIFLFLSIAATYFIYHFFLKWLSRRIDMDRYFDPLFQIGRRKR